MFVHLLVVVLCFSKWHSIMWTAILKMPKMVEAQPHWMLPPAHVVTNWTPFTFDTDYMLYEPNLPSSIGSIVVSLSVVTIVFCYHMIFTQIIIVSWILVLCDTAVVTLVTAVIKELSHLVFRTAFGRISFWLTCLRKPFLLSKVCLKDD